MLAILGGRTYRHLFLAQVVALLGTGLATVALGLLAYDLAGDRAGLVLGAVFTIKMVAYVGIAPIAGAFADRVNRRVLLVTLDVVRAGAALCLPFVSEFWQVYVLIFLLQSASAAFTPTFQATIPDVLPEENRYTRALTLSRLAYGLENIVSPTLAGLLLAVMSYKALFLGTVAGLVASGVLVVSVLLPSPQPSEPRGIYDRSTHGIRIYLATPRLRGLLALNLAAAAGGAMVLVNTVVPVRGELGLGESALAWTMGIFGAGSMLGTAGRARHRRGPAPLARGGPGNAVAPARRPAARPPAPLRTRGDTSARPRAGDRPAASGMARRIALRRPGRMRFGEPDMDLFPNERRLRAESDDRRRPRRFSPLRRRKSALSPFLSDAAERTNVGVG